MWLLAAGADHRLAADVILVSQNVPSLDIWFYPFNSNPGSKASAAIFGAVTNLDDGFFPEFDNRDGQMVIGFDTSTAVPTGLGPGGYTVTAATAVLTISSSETFQYDPTPDPYTSWLASDDPNFETDPDPGRPLELFGAGFRCGHTASTFPENGVFCDGCNCLFGTCKSVRCVYPIDYDQGCQPRDVSNNIDEAFDPVPFAVGVNGSLSSGDPVPLDTELTFELNVDDPCIQGYLGQALDEGMLDLVVASIFLAVQQQAGTFPKVYCKEDVLVELGVVSAARLEMTVGTGIPGDLDENGIVNVTDLLILLGQFGPCPDPCPPSCEADIDDDCVVGVIDLLIMLGNWTTEP